MRGVGYFFLYFIFVLFFSLLSSLNENVKFQWRGDLFVFGRFDSFLALGQGLEFNLAHQFGGRQRNDVLGW